MSRRFPRAAERAFRRHKEVVPDAFISYPSFLAGWDAALEVQQDYRQVNGNARGAPWRAFATLFGMAATMLVVMIGIGLKYGEPVNIIALPITLSLGVLAVLLWRRADKKDMEQQSQFSEKWS